MPRHLFRSTVWLAMGVALCALVPRAGAQQATSDSVWVNLRSGVYHCPGTEYFGKTTRGEYLTEGTARARGYRGNGGRRCAPERVADTTTLVLPDSGPPLPADSTSACILTRVVDGDTIDCAMQGRVRPIGLDAPEGDQEPFSTAATAAAAVLISPGDTLQLLLGAEVRDRYGRLLSYVWHRGASFNWLMIRQGWAVSLPYAPNTRYAELFAAAERRARAEQRGLWRVNGFACRPKDRRDRRC